MNSVIAVNAKKIIAQKGYKQKSVAMKAGYTPSAFSNMMNGRKIITDFDVMNIANVLEVTPNELFGVSDDTNGPKSA